jgi:hypothetical protein
MERNSAGQVIVKESGSLLLSIPCITSTISINTYNRFLLDEKEFTELVPTIDKDALINRLESELFTANTRLTQEQINIRGGCNVGITNEQVVRNSINRQKITFDTVSGEPYYNSIQSNGLPVYSLAEQAAILYEAANSKRFYTFAATIKYRYRYIGTAPATKTTTRTHIQFYKDNNVSSGPLAPGVNRTDNIAGTYKPGDVTGLYTLNLLDTNYGLGGITDKIFVALVSPLSDFEMVIYPESTFTVLPE